MADDRSRIDAAAELLLDWYLREARDLPWRRTDDPYAILVSEIMLQQTRVEAVRERWVQFLERFPDIETLAAAEEDEVLALWSGLGYYRRARSLHALARVVVEEHYGRLPTDRDALRALPGVGDYTSAAVASIAFGEPCLSVDGNVARVTARLLASGEDMRRPAARRELQTLFTGALDRWPPGELNQSLMELGARVCLPRGPRCGDCPCAAVCRARELGLEREIPPSRKSRVRRVVEAAAVVGRAGRLLLVRGQRPGQLETMWEFPTLDSRHRPAPDAAPVVAEGELPPGEDELASELAAHLAARGIPAGDLHPIGIVRHAITDRRIDCHVYRVELREPLSPADAGTPGAASERRWVPAGEAEALPLASATRKILALLAPTPSERARSGLADP